MQSLRKLVLWIWIAFVSTTFIIFSASIVLKRAKRHASSSVVPTSKFLRKRKNFPIGSSPATKTASLVPSSVERRGQLTMSGGRTASSARAIMPKNFLYGTAWKKDRTKELVELAVRSGFRGIDTACQPKHYFEPGVGEALETLYHDNVISRQDIFLQTKFTPIRGQDPNNVPYDPAASLGEQVMQSFQASSRNLRTDFVDSLVLHSPLSRIEDTLTVWRAFEELYKSGKVGQLGMSNTYDVQTLRSVYEAAEVKPTVLQNRFYAESGYDKEIRQFCQQHGIQYQSFWTLTANPHVLKSGAVRTLAAKYSKTPQQVLFRFVQSIGILPLTGTSTSTHMQQDLDTVSFSLEPAEVQSIEALL